LSQEIDKIEEEIIEEFSFFDDPLMQYDYLIDLGKKLPPLSEKYKTDDNVVKGCQSTVWVASENKDGRVYYFADSNTVITKGIIALLVRVLSGRKPDDVIEAKLGFIDKINLRSQLSPMRSNGLNAMIQRMKSDAVKYRN
jgi:cysteine desulfuration protein SufE